MALAAGEGSLRLRDAATDQLMAATSKAQAPAVSTGASPSLIGMSDENGYSGHPEQKREPKPQREALGSEENNFSAAP